MTYDTIKNELDAQWNGAVITEPSYVNGQLNQNLFKSGQLHIAVDDAPRIINLGFTGGLCRRVWNFTITLAASSRANLDLYIGEIKRIIRAKSVTSGWWTMSGLPVYKEFPKFVTAEILCQEIMATSTW